MKQTHARIQRTITGTGKQLGPIESHERNVLAITRRIHRLTADRVTLRRKLKETNAELRHTRRELRAVLQRDSSITVEDERLELAGKADAIDATNAKP